MTVEPMQLNQRVFLDLALTGLIGAGLRAV